MSLGSAAGVAFLGALGLSVSPFLPLLVFFLHSHLPPHSLCEHCAKTPPACGKSHVARCIVFTKVDLNMLTPQTK